MGTTFSMALLSFGTVLTAHVVVLSANAQGPPPGAPASQPDPRLASLADRWVRWILSIDTSIEPNPFTTVYQGDCSQLIQGNMIVSHRTGGVQDLPVPVDHGFCNVSSITSIFFSSCRFHHRGLHKVTNRTVGLKACAPLKWQTPALGQPVGGLMQQAK